MNADAVMVEPALDLDVDVSDFTPADATQLLRWQTLWVSLVERPWTTLAVVPVSGPKLAVDVANHLTEAARSMRQAAFAMGEAGIAADVPGRRIIHLSSPLHSPSVALTARRADAVVLVVALGQDTMDAVERVKEMLGVETILGCVAANVRPHKR